MRLIDADALIQRMKSEKQDCYNNGLYGISNGIANAITWAKDSPVIDAVPVVHGEWKLFCDGWFEYHVCSLCGERTMDTVLGKPRAKYCPNCGAKMDGGVNSEQA